MTSWLPFVAACLVSVTALGLTYVATRLKDHRTQLLAPPRGRHARGRS